MRTAVVLVGVVAALIGAASANMVKIVGGNEAYPHQFPWQAGVRIHLDEEGASCGGSLIAEDWVLTAAHCAEPPIEQPRFSVVLGAHHIFNNTEEGRVTIDVDKVFVHPLWKGQKPNSTAGDIALFKLKQKAPLSASIQTIRLPREEQKRDSFWRKTVTISGWGLERTGDKTNAPVLRYAINKIVSNLYCKLFYLFKSFNFVGDQNVCFSGWGWKGGCNGDSGGPMVLYEDDGPTLIGVASFAFVYACNLGFPTAYTRTTTYLDWINETIQKH
ncbi:Chymotrypsin BI [Frankliniella fusca]|uniref:Chymotrypsin BI n=1 Tax=Frankliniella fusca TaxID=407009 RepID=A0AAE1LUG9_9NEOP|nr:Chymotrypsin BI [Frankliniella fusca]